MRVNFAPGKATQEMYEEYVQLTSRQYIIDKAIEEMAELIQQLIKVKYDAPDELELEFADVLVTLAPVAMMCDPALVEHGQTVRINKIISHIQELRGESNDVIAKTG